MTAPVEVTTRLATTVDSLSQAWAFVMNALDRDGIGENPTITITPLWFYSVSDMDREDDYMPPRQFSVVVSGFVQHTREDA